MTVKVGVWIGESHEVLYDSVTDEVIFRKIGEPDPEVIRVSYAQIAKARVKANNELSRKRKA